jgi:hypothetical protein
LGTESPEMPPIPDLAIIAQVVRLAEAYADERFEQRPPEHPEYAGDDLDWFLQPRPRRLALLNYLRGLADETLAGLYGLYRVGDLYGSSAGEAADRYRKMFDLAMEPIHRPRSAIDLVALGPLADGLRRGLELLGLPPDRHETQPGDHLHPTTYPED